MNAQMHARLAELLSNGDAQTMAVFPVGEANSRDALSETVRVAVLMKR
jgi:DTW domain-containing protein YfiP